MEAVAGGGTTPVDTLARGASMNATSANFGALFPLAIDRNARDVLVGSSHGVFRIRVENSTIERVAGIAPDARATSFRGGDLQLRSPRRIAFAPSARRPHFSDRGRNQIYALESNGLVRTVFGSGASALPQVGSLALASPIAAPFGIVFGDDADVYVVSSEHGLVARLDASTDTVAMFMSQPALVAGTEVRLPNGIARRRNGHIVLADTGNHRIIEFDANGADPMVIAGTAGAEGCTAASGLASRLLRSARRRDRWSTTPTSPQRQPSSFASTSAG